MAWTTMVVAALWVTCLGLLLEAIGFAIPFWFGYETPASTLTSDKTFQSYVGSWYVMSCVKGEASSCKSVGIEPETKDTTSNVDVIGLTFLSETQDLIAENAAKVLGYSKYWIALQIAATCSIGLSLLAGLLLICCRCAGIHSKCMFWTAAGFLTAGTCGVLGTTGYSAWLVADKFDFIQSINAARFPWSILLFGIGGIFAAIACFILLLIVCSWRKYGEYRSSDDDSLIEEDVPMSDISKSRKERGYDNPRYPTDYPRDPYGDAKRGYQDRNGYGGSRKYDYAPDYNSRDRGYDRRDRDRGGDRYGYDDRSYDRQYNSKDRGYDRDMYDRRAPNYERDYAMSRKDNMYRPYNVQRY